MCTEYEEGCNSIRHYSSHVKELRKMTIVQGFVIITATFFLIKDGLFPYAMCLSLFGLVFTIALVFQTLNDMANFESHLKGVEDIINSENRQKSTWRVYISNRNNRFRNRAYKNGVIYGPSIIIGLTFTLIFVFCLFGQPKKTTIVNTNKDTVQIIVPKDGHIEINK